MSFDKGILCNTFAQRCSFGVDGSISHATPRTGADAHLDKPLELSGMNMDLTCDPTAQP